MGSMHRYLGAGGWSARALVVALGLSLGGGATRAQAQEGEGESAAPEGKRAETAEEQAAREEQARTLFMAGRTYFAQGEYEMALESFRRAHALSEHPELLMNISLSAERLGRTEVAVEHLARYLEEAEHVEGRETLELRLANLRKRLERERADVAEREAVTEGGGPAPEPPDEPGVWGIPTPAFIAYTVGAVGLATFGTFGILTLTENNRLSDGCGATDSCTDDQLSTLRAYTITADVGLGLALAGAATGTLLLFLMDDDGGDDEASGADVAVTPLLGPRSGGAKARIRF